MTNSTFDQFTALQNALSELNYSQPLLRESVPLVQAIFTDLIDVTKKYSQLRKQSEHKQNELKSQLNPIKIENDNLTKSNNTLHLKIIENNDQFEQKMKKIEAECEKLQLEKNELNVLLNQKKHKIKNQENMISKLKKKMNAILSSNGTNHKQLIGKTSKISFNSFPLSSSSSSSPSISTKNEENFGNIEIEEKDMNDNDDKYLLLQNENESLLAQIKQLTMVCNQDKSKIIELENSLNARKQEMDRINDNLVIDDNRIEFIKYKQSKQNEAAKIKHLESQIDVLQNEVLEKENEIKQNIIKDEIIEKLKEENKDLNTKLDVAWKEMDKLKLDLTAIKQTSKALQIEKKYDIIKSTKKLSKNVNELTLLHNKVEELTKLNKVLETKLANKSKQNAILNEKKKEDKSSNHTLNVALEIKEKEIDKLRMEQIDLMKVCDELKQKLKEFKHEMEINRNHTNNLEMKLKSTDNRFNILSKENGDLLGKYEELKKLNTENQEENKAMNKENESLKFKIKCLEKDKESLNDRVYKVMEQKSDFEKSDTQKQTENFELVKKLQHIEFKNDDLKKEKEWNDKLLLQHQAKISKLEKDKKELSLKIERINKHLDEWKLKYNEIEYKYNLSMKQNDSLEVKVKESENVISSLKVIKCEYETNEKSKNHLELELIRLQNENEKYKKENVLIENNNKRKENVIHKIEKEKNDLKLILQQMQQRITAFQQRLTTINADRDHVKQLYDQCMIEINDKNEVIENLNVNLNHLKTEYTKSQNMMTDLEKKYNELQESYTNKDTLCRESMHKIKTFNKIQENLNENIKQEMEAKKLLQQTVRELNKDRDDMMIKYDEVRKEYNNLKDNIVPKMNQEIILSQVKTGELKVLCNKLDDGHKNAQIKIEQLYHKNEELIKLLNDEQSKYENVEKRLEETCKERENMKVALEKLVNEHDKIQNELDKNVEIIQILNNNIKQEKHKNAEFQAILSETQQQYRMQQKQLIEYAQKLKANEELIRKMQTEIIPRMKEENRLKSEQLKNSMNDLNNITKENQFLNNEYAATINDRDTKNNQLSTALNKILYLESQCTNIQNERNQILENYKSVVIENEKLQKLSELLDKNKSDFNLKISVLEEHIARRDHRIKALEKSLTESNLTNHELQRQNQIITRDLQRVNLNNTKNQTMSENLQKDLSALQNNVVQKQMSEIDKKTSIIIEFKKENKNLQKIINELNLEKEIALTSLEAAEKKMQKLEGIIGNLRIDNISNNEISMKEKDAKIGGNYRKFENR